MAARDEVDVVDEVPGPDELRVDTVGESEDEHAVTIAIAVVTSAPHRRMVLTFGIHRP
jgi:hypothetical protein